MSRKYHVTEFQIRPTGDAFAVGGVVITVPFSAATQTETAIIPGLHHVLGIVVQQLAAHGVPVTSRKVLELADCVSYYIRSFRNNPAAARQRVDGAWIRA